MGQGDLPKLLAQFMGMLFAAHETSLRNAYYNILAGLLAVVFGGYGTYLKRGRPEFSSL